MQPTIKTIFDFVDARLDFYLQAANRRTGQAFRPSTQKNQTYVVKLFVGFALKLGLDYNRPSISLAMAFIEHLAATQRTAASVISTVSTLKAALLRHSISTRAFAAPPVELLIRSVKINKRTPAKQRPPVLLHQLRAIVTQLHHVDYSAQMKVVVILLFTTAFRQSNLAPTSVGAFDPTRHLTRADVRLMVGGVHILEKWSKTRQQIVNDRWISVPRVVGSLLCLHAALTRLLRVSPSTSRTQPLLVFDDGNPIPASFISRQFKAALLRAGLGQRALTLHSLRRGGARFMQQAGVPTNDIASHGGWKSAAIYRYINNPTKPAAFKALKCLK